MINLKTEAPQVKTAVNQDAIIAQNIVKKIFFNIKMCLTFERSKVKLSSLDKLIINQMLTDKTTTGINDYIANMHDSDIKQLIDEIQEEISKRKKVGK